MRRGHMDMKKLFIILSYSLFCLAIQANAGDANQKTLDELPAPPVLPDPVESGEAIEPEVTIIQRDDATIEEYRINGQLYMVKVTPVVGPHYYIMDKYGDGSMETRMGNIYNDVVVPQWVLFTWD